MKKRIAIEEVSIKRIIKAVENRFGEIPHSLTWEFSSYSKENRARLERFRDIHYGKKCFLVANGPSLNQMNLEILQNEITFGLNRIYVNFQNSSFRPKYYVAVNELVLDQFAQEISTLSMPRFVNWKKRHLFTSNQENLFFLKSQLSINDHFSPEITKPFVFGGTVTFVALQIAFFMGIKRVIIVGLDHSYAEKGIPNTVESKKELSDMSHFHPNYFPAGTKWQIPDLRRSEVDYFVARKYFEKNGREILDATIDGKCTLFSKVDFNKALLV